MNACKEFMKRRKQDEAKSIKERIIKEKKDQKRKKENREKKCISVFKYMEVVHAMKIPETDLSI